ncbi:unnamed protein product [Caretta caretta]
MRWGWGWRGGRFWARWLARPTRPGVPPAWRSRISGGRWQETAPSPWRGSSGAFWGAPGERDPPTQRPPGFRWAGRREKSRLCGRNK